MAVLETLKYKGISNILHCIINGANLKSTLIIKVPICEYEDQEFCLESCLRLHQHRLNNISNMCKVEIASYFFLKDSRVKCRPRSTCTLHLQSAQKEITSQVY